MAISFAGVRVLDPPRAVRRLLWHVLSIGVVWRDETEDHPGMDKAGLFLFRVKSGAGILELPDERHALERGPTWWLVDLGQPRRYVPQRGRPMLTLGVRFSGPAVEGWRDEAFAGRAGFPLSDRAHSKGLAGAVAALMRLTAKPEVSDWQVHQVLMRVLGVVLRERVLLAPAVAVLPSPVRRVIEAVQANPLRDWRAAELATIAQASYSSLREHFKRSQGETVHEFLQRIRLEQARERLTDLRLSVKEVASQLHFSSEFYFSRWFRAAAGVTPSHFRALLHS